MFSEFIKTTLCDLSKRGKIAFQFRPFTDVTKVRENNSYEFSGSIEKINWSSNRRDHMKIIDLLLNGGSDVNCTDNKGNTPVFYAYAAATKISGVMENNLKCLGSLWREIVKDLSQELYERRKLILSNLMKLNVNLDKSYKNGSILHHILASFTYSFAKETDEMMKLFLEKGANVDALDENMLTPLHQAILSTNKNLISILLDYGANVNYTDPSNNSTPLLVATSQLIRWSNQDILKMLVDKGANVNARQSDGKTALHNLVLQRKSLHIGQWLPLCKILMEAGADINSQDSKGHTPLYLACKRKSGDAVKAFLKNGADVDIQTNGGSTVFSYLLKKYKLFNDDDDSMDARVEWIVSMLEEHVIKMNIIGMPVSKKALLSFMKYSDDYLKTDEDEKKFIAECEAEVQKLRDAKIHANCTLYNLMFKGENALSQVVENPMFKAIVQSKKFKEKYPHYGYLVRLKYQTGADRAKLLPEAKFVLNNLVGLHLPHTCSENIFKYFTNVELRESVGILLGMLDLKVENTDEIQLRSRTAHKRQKVN